MYINILLEEIARHTYFWTIGRSQCFLCHWCWCEADGRCCLTHTPARTKDSGSNIPRACTGSSAVAAWDDSAWLIRPHLAHLGAHRPGSSVDFWFHGWWTSHPIRWECLKTQGALWWLGMTGDHFLVANHCWKADTSCCLFLKSFHTMFTDQRSPLF